jgi:copper homeostasis protein
MNRKILEVIVTDLDEAVEAAAGGADRLEVVRALKEGGLTPELDLVDKIARTVRIPIRIMLRENNGLALGGGEELRVLCEKARAISRLGADGLVIGFNSGQAIDIAAMRAVLESAPGMKATFHRAFDELADPLGAIALLKELGTVDRILTVGGKGPWAVRKERLRAWQRAAAPEIKILAGAGIDRAVLQDLQDDELIVEIHIGRAARIPQESAGRVSRVRVAESKDLLA